MKIYRGMDQAALDAAYNNTAAVSDSARNVADWERRSAEVAQSFPHHLDLRYGPHERNRFDFFRSSRDRTPILAFIHGGYWQTRAKEMFRFLAAGALAHDICFSNIGYTLAPQATLREIVDEVRSAISAIAAQAESLGGDASRIYVSGWSAGGHLTAMCLDHPNVRGGLAISGIFHLEPIRLSYLNEKLALTAVDVPRLSPAADIRPTTRPLMLAYGTAELPELQRQSREFASARASAGLPGRLAALEGHNHFTILEELAAPEGALTALLLELIKR